MFSALVTLLLATPGVEVSHRRVVTDDGASLALYRYSPPGGGLSQRPVLLLSDFSFDKALYEHFEHGLARYLVRRGFAVYVAELRGQGASSPGTSLRTLVHLDLPAIARAIATERTGPLDLVAHGWLGTLALAATTKELEVARVVAINTPVVFEPPGVLLGTLLEQGGHLSSFADSPQGAAAFDALYLNGSPVDPVLLEELRGRVRDLSRGQALEWLTWMRTGDLPLDDGSSVRSRLARYDRPTLLLLGLADSIAGPEYCTPLAGPVRLRSFSRFDSGDDFSHLTSLVGRNAASTIFPEISRFLLEDQGAR